MTFELVKIEILLFVKHIIILGTQRETRDTLDRKLA